MMRHLLGTLALVAATSVAGAQQTPPKQTHGDSVSATHRNARAGAKSRGMKARPASGEVALDRGGPGQSVHAVPRDWVGADDTRCDALCERERKMDAMCGKSREKCGKP